MSLRTCHPSNGFLAVARRRLCILGIFATAAFCSGCGHSQPEQSVRSDKELPVVEARVLTIEPSTWPALVRSQGSLLPDEVSIVGAKVQGRVHLVHVDLGDPVKTGDPLVELDQREFELQVAQAEAQLSQARSVVGLKPGEAVESLDRKNAPPVRQEKALWDEAKAVLERSRQLLSQNAMTTAEFDQIAAAERVAEAKYQSSLNSVDEKIALIGVREAELSLARQNLQDAVIRAPFDGLVDQRSVAPGAYVQVGQAIITLVRTNPLRFRGTIPERHAQQLAIGQTVRLEIESVAEPRTVTVTRVSPALNQLSRALLFEANVDNEDGTLRPGLFAEAELILDPTAKAIIVPASSIVIFAGAEKVWKVNADQLEETVIETGRREGDRIEVIHGLESGDQILLDGHEGQVARIKPLPAERVPSEGTESLNPTDLPASTNRTGPKSDATSSSE